VRSSSWESAAAIRFSVQVTGRLDREDKPPSAAPNVPVNWTTGRIPMCVKDGLMRIHPWLAAISSLCLLIAAGEHSARAQQATQAVFESGKFDDAVEGRVSLKSTSTSTDPVSQLRGQSPGPMAFNPAQPPTNPAAMWPQGAPPQSFHPYPQISPYHPANVAMDTTYNRKGLWFREMLHRNRDYFMTLEYLLIDYGKPANTWIGADPAPFFTNDPSAGAAGGAGTTVSGSLVGVTVDNMGLAGPALFGFGDSTGLQRVTIGPGVYPFPFIFPGPDQTARQALVDENLFPIHTLNNSWFKDGSQTDGMRARWGYFDEDGSGLMLTGWFGTESSGLFRSGRASYNGVDVTQAFIFANAPPGGSALVFPRNGALPLLVRDDFMNTGLDPIPELVTLGFSGMAQKFDVLFEYDFTQFAAGGALHWYHEPIYKRKWVTVRPTIGARYQYLDERFRFRGIDSGLGYDVTQLVGGGGAGGNQGAPTYRPSDTDIFAVVDDVGNGFFFEANLRSEIDSHMAGPEAGIRYDFGNSKHFSIWGQSTVALLANHQRMSLTGQNIGDPINYFLVTGDNWADPTDGIDTQFKDEKTHTSASPMFEQSVFLDIDIFKYVPILKNMHVLEDARFRTGYTYTVIGGVNRPADVIVWNSFPDTPNIRTDRKTWDMHNWSFAVDWEF